VLIGNRGERQEPAAGPAGQDHTFQPSFPPRRADAWRLAPGCVVFADLPLELHVIQDSAENAGADVVELLLGALGQVALRLSGADHQDHPVDARGQGRRVRDQLAALQLGELAAQLGIAVVDAQELAAALD
jgi:hypothetical protein